MPDEFEDDLFEASKPARRAKRPREAETGEDASNAGHRERLRQRFMTGGAEALPDYELLELVLFSALRRQDTKALAKTLISEFGSFAEVISASENRLGKIEGVGPSVITALKVVRAAALRLMQGEIMGKPVLASWSDVAKYCRASIGYEEREHFRILFLDKRNRLIGDEVQGVGTVDHTPVYVREVVKRALEHSATALVLVHNHPSGDTKPSNADIEMTRHIESAAKPFGIVIHDHLIVGRETITSLRALKLLGRG